MFRILDSYAAVIDWAVVPEEEDMDANDDSHSPWYLFNDFSVKNISEQEALGFPGAWKVSIHRSVIANCLVDAGSCMQVPTVLYLERVDACARLDFASLPYHIDLSLLSQDTNIAT